MTLEAGMQDPDAGMADGTARHPPMRQPAVSSPTTRGGTAPAAGLQGIGPREFRLLRADMVRFAMLQLRNADAAEDLVQEALEIALLKSSSFAGLSTLKTWVFSILRHRIIDHLRRSARTVPMSSLVDDDEDWLERLDAMFGEEGRWRDGPRPVSWPDPEESMRTRQFWTVLEACLDHLPAAAGRAFMMREFLGFETDEICEQLGITTNNFHVMIHRARLKLRTCMDSGWGRPEGASC